MMSVGTSSWNASRFIFFGTTLVCSTTTQLPELTRMNKGCGSRSPDRVGRMSSRNARMRACGVCHPFLLMIMSYWNAPIWKRRGFTLSFVQGSANGAPSTGLSALVRKVAADPSVRKLAWFCAWKLIAVCSSGVPPSGR